MKTLDNTFSLEIKKSKQFKDCHWTAFKVKIQNCKRKLLRSSSRHLRRNRSGKPKIVHDGLLIELQRQHLLWAPNRIAKVTFIILRL